MRKTLTTLAVTTLLAAGCGGGAPANQQAADQQAADQKPADQQAASSSSAQPESPTAAAQQAQQGAQQFAQGLQQLAQGMQQTGADGKPVPPVDFEKLLALLPEVDGWTRDKPEGRQVSSPFAVSTAEAHYQKGDAGMDVTITDSALNKLVVAPFTMMLASNYSERTTSGYKKATKIHDMPAWEEWNSDDKEGEVGIVVGDRFIVQAKGSSLENMDAVHAFVDKIDLQKLQSVK